MRVARHLNVEKVIGVELLRERIDLAHILPLLTREGDALGIDDPTTHVLPLADAPYAYEIFQKKQDGCVKAVLKPPLSGY